jgi:hypothetical protein
MLRSGKEDRLWIADPKALHYILQATSYLYVKTSIRKETVSLMTDRGLPWADGMADPHSPPDASSSNAQVRPTNGKERA